MSERAEREEIYCVLERKLQAELGPKAFASIKAEARRVERREASTKESSLVDVRATRGETQRPPPPSPTSPPPLNSRQVGLNSTIEGASLFSRLGQAFACFTFLRSSVEKSQDNANSKGATAAAAESLAANSACRNTFGHRPPPVEISSQQSTPAGLDENISFGFAGRCTANKQHSASIVAVGLLLIAVVVVIGIIVARIIPLPPPHLATDTLFDTSMDIADTLSEEMSGRETSAEAHEIGLCGVSHFRCIIGSGIRRNLGAMAQRQFDGTCPSFDCDREASSHFSNSRELQFAIDVTAALFEVDLANVMDLQHSLVAGCQDFARWQLDHPLDTILKVPQSGAIVFAASHYLALVLPSRLTASIPALRRSRANQAALEGFFANNTVEAIKLVQKHDALAGAETHCWTSLQILRNQAGYGSQQQIGDGRIRYYLDWVFPRACRGDRLDVTPPDPYMVTVDGGTAKATDPDRRLVKGVEPAFERILRYAREAWLKNRQLAASDSAEYIAQASERVAERWKMVHRQAAEAAYRLPRAWKGVKELQ